MVLMHVPLLCDISRKGKGSGEIYTSYPNQTERKKKKR